MTKRVTRFIREVIKNISKPEMRILPGQLAFFLVISLIPLIALVGTIALQLSLSTKTIIEVLESVLPFEITEDIVTFVSGTGLTFNIIIFFISAFILASNGAHSMIITSNEIYKVESNSYFKRRFKAIGMTFILVFALLFLLLVPVFGDNTFNILTSSNTNNGQSINFAYNIYKLMQYPVTMILIYFCVKLLYTVAPDRKIKTENTTTGSIITTVGWILATKLYSIYAGSFSSYNVFYGSISNILFLLIWVYILSYIFVLGMAFNASNTMQDDYETKSINLKDVESSN